MTAITGGSDAGIMAICRDCAAAEKSPDPTDRRPRVCPGTLLTVMFSRLSFNYAYVWLIYPTTLGLHLVISEASHRSVARLKVAWIHRRS